MRRIPKTLIFKLFVLDSSFLSRKNTLKGVVRNVKTHALVGVRIFRGFCRTGRMLSYSNWQREPAQTRYVQGSTPWESTNCPVSTMEMPAPSKRVLLQVRVLYRVPYKNNLRPSSNRLGNAPLKCRMSGSIPTGRTKIICGGGQTGKASGCGPDNYRFESYPSPQMRE